MLRWQLEVKLLQIATFRIYIAAILKMCQTYNFYSIFIRFGDPENMRLDTKIVFLSGLPVKISTKTQYIDWCMAILFMASKHFPQGCQAGIRLILTRKVSNMMNQS